MVVFSALLFSAGKVTLLLGSDDMGLGGFYFKFDLVDLAPSKDCKSAFIVVLAISSVFLISG